MTDTLLTVDSQPKIVDFASAPAETTVSKPAADRLLSGAPQHTARNYFSDTTGQLFAGVWESTPGRWRVRYSENEFCHITNGEVRIESVSGDAWTFKRGDSFVIPAGFEGVWHVTQQVTKLYVIFEAASK